MNGFLECTICGKSVPYSEIADEDLFTNTPYICDECFDEIKRDPLVALVVIMEDELVHTTNRPFCCDLFCPCHEDLELYRELIYEPEEAGLLAGMEGQRLFWGEQIGGTR